jgi:hypothetical protein
MGASHQSKGTELCRTSLLLKKSRRYTGTTTSVPSAAHDGPTSGIASATTAARNVPAKSSHTTRWKSTTTADSKS